MENPNDGLMDFVAEHVEMKYLQAKESGMSDPVVLVLSPPASSKGDPGEPVPITISALERTEALEWLASWEPRAVELARSTVSPDRPITVMVGSSEGFTIYDRAICTEV
ncbi:hypothetical protein [Tautonia rosea]|uniref:hypothetical protein n=1 Tax=Tautonia rosea TaxID=2728037 RepID=UPI00147434A0|nr:hypothetical protein [Tautonia rosea]